MIEIPCGKCKQYEKFRKLKDKENDRRKKEAYKHF